MATRQILVCVFSILVSFFCNGDPLIHTKMLFEGFLTANKPNAGERCCLDCTDFPNDIPPYAGTVWEMDVITENGKNFKYISFSMKS